MHKRTLLDFFQSSSDTDSAQRRHDRNRAVAQRRRDAAAPSLSDDTDARTNVNSVNPAHEGHQYALTMDGEWVNALTEVRAEGVSYQCDCPQKHRMKLVKPLGHTDKRSFKSYFAHVAVGWQGICSGGGEGKEHKQAKHLLREWMRSPENSLVFKETVCPHCSESRVVGFNSCDYQIILEQRSSDKAWRYDCLLVTRGTRQPTPRYALEIVSTHWSSEGKLDRTRGAGVGIAEFLAEDVIRTTTTATAGAGKRSELVLHNKRPLHRKCAACKRKETEQGMLAALEKERAEWIAQALVQWQEYVRLDALREEEARSRALRWRRMQEVAELDLMLADGALTDRSKAMRLMRACCHLLSIESTRWRSVSLADIEASSTQLGFRVEWRGGDGVRVVGFVLIVDDDWQRNGGEPIQQALRTVWRVHDVPREYTQAISADTVLRRAAVMLQAYASDPQPRLGFRDCLFAMLVQVENEHQICATCGLQGHRSFACRQRFCVRCGNRGHSFGECFARKSVHGVSLS
jgi:hypothetical protein